MKINEIANELELHIPLQYQESYDNVGLLVGNPEHEVKAILLCVDVTERVIDDAISHGANLIITHHPIIYKGLTQFTGKNYVERTIAKAIKYNIAIYTAHTNLDNVYTGVNQIISNKLNLNNLRVLYPHGNDLRKLVTFVPVEHVEKVRNALFNAGAGHIGNYDACSFACIGEGTFRGGKDTNPFVGEKGKIHNEKEMRLETIFYAHTQQQILTALLANHPYEEVAYDIYKLHNINNHVGSGMIGELDREISSLEFLKHLVKVFNTRVIRYTDLHKKKIKKIAVCGGSGGFLIEKAIAANADVFVTGDIKYHDFFNAESKIIIADVGHFESEQFTTEFFNDFLKKKYPDLSVYFTKVNTNPINYLTR